MTTRQFLLAACLLVAPALALAQAPAGTTPTRVRGTVETLDGNVLTVKDKMGQNVTINLAPNFTVRSVLKRSLADIKDGDFLASVSTRGADGKLRAIGITIFPDELKGRVPQLQAPWDLPSDSIMTNAIVTGFASATDGRTIKMKFKDTDTELVVPPDTPIVTYGPGDAGLLKTGAYVVILGQKQPDGKITAANVSAEKDGVKPPM